jgi:predicted nucleic acid-binding protein
LRRLYLDTSAYLCLLLNQDGADRLGEETLGAELLSSVLLELEARRNVVRLTRQGLLQADQYKEAIDRIEHDMQLFTLRDLTLELCRSRALPAVAIPRSLDLAHLRTALWFHGLEKIDRFVTKDASQEHAAKELGLPV